MTSEATTITTADETEFSDQREFVGLAVQAEAYTVSDIVSCTMIVPDIAKTKQFVLLHHRKGSDMWTVIYGILFGVVASAMLGSLFLVSSFVITGKPPAEPETLAGPMILCTCAILGALVGLGRVIDRRPV